MPILRGAARRGSLVYFADLLNINFATWGQDTRLLCSLDLVAKNIIECAARPGPAQYTRIVYN